MTCLQCTLGEALQPLQKLRDLFLGVYLSDEDIFYEHIMHAQAYYDTRDPYGPADCGLCHKTFSSSIQEIELAGSAALAQYLPQLKSVTWSSFFSARILEVVPSKSGRPCVLREKEAR